MYLTSLLPFLALSSALSLTPRQSNACNNSPDLCAKSYSSITHLGAHDSPFVRDATTGNSASGNQYYNSTTQLDAGVRLLSAQVHRSNGGWHLCHSSCDLLDAGTLVDWLKHIKTWLDANPNDVVTILLVNSDNAKVSDFDSQFQQSGITNLAYRPPSQTPPVSWPTLQQLITANTRLMAFVGSLDVNTITPSTNYLMDEFTFIFENSYNNEQPSDFSCVPERPSAIKGNSASAIASNRMPFMNHFLYTSGTLDIQMPNTDNITTTNSPGTTAVGELGTALQTCSQTYGKAPTFVLVDFFSEGPAITAVDNINGITPVGRKTLPARDSTTSRSDSSFSGVQSLVQQVKDGQTPKKAAWVWGGGKWSFGGVNLSGKGGLVE